MALLDGIGLVAMGVMIGRISEGVWGLGSEILSCAFFCRCFFW